MQTRPILQIERTATDNLLEIAGWLALAVLFALTIWNYTHLPDTIPTHFNAAGQPDDYGSKATILILPVFAILIFSGLTVLNNYPHIFNYPLVITPDNARQQYTFATRMIRYLKLALVVVFALLVSGASQVSSGKTTGLGTWFLPLVLALVFVPVVFFVVLALKIKRAS